ncbi:MAG TPA: papain-like cysteine protease family protein [Candidatus Kapabacteria bacterium]|nr:papain-like cysteine protease family protein [Candidatus Kapabacteria bacterium]
MKLRTLSFIFLGIVWLLLTFSSYAITSPPDSNELNVPCLGQQSDLVCWAACGEMISTFYSKFGGELLTQCDQLVLDGKVCTDDYGRGTPIFNRDSTATHYSVEKEMDKFFSWKDIREQIDAGHPFISKWGYGLEDNYYHFTITYGYTNIKSGYAGSYVCIIDPLPIRKGTTRTIPYSIYTRQEGSISMPGTSGSVKYKSHENEYFNIFPISPKE